MTHISAPGARSIAEVDANLRGLNAWLAERAQSSRLSLRDIRAFRADQDLLLDARLERMSERDVRAAVAA